MTTWLKVAGLPAGVVAGTQNPDDGVPPEVWALTEIRFARAHDTIRFPGRPETERVVAKTSAPYTQNADWHVHPAANEYRPNEMQAKWREVRVQLAEGGGISGPLSFKPDMPIEIKTTEVELAAIMALGGWENRGS